MRRTSAKEVHVLDFDIPEFGYSAGDHLVIRRWHPQAPVIVVKRLGQEALTTAIKHTRNAEALVAIGSRHRSPVSTPIEASSDEVALFDLITDSGGRMPSEET